MSGPGGEARAAPAMIAAMRAEDIPAVLVLWRRSEGLTLRQVDEPAALTRFLERNPGMSFVARSGEAVVGAVICGHDGRRGYLHHLAVGPAHRRKGVGAALVECCRVALEREGIRKCHLFVRVENEAAKRFWERMGWTVRQDILLLSRNFSNDANA